MKKLGYIAILLGLLYLPMSALNLGRGLATSIEDMSSLDKIVYSTRLHPPPGRPLSDDELLRLHRAGIITSTFMLAISLAAIVSGFGLLIMRRWAITVWLVAISAAAILHGYTFYAYGKHWIGVVLTLSLCAASWHEFIHSRRRT